MPDGSYLVVDATDLSGNQSSTLMVVNNTNALDRAYADRADFAFGSYRYCPGRPRAVDHDEPDVGELDKQRAVFDERSRP